MLKPPSIFLTSPVCQRDASLIDPNEVYRPAVVFNEDLGNCDEAGRISDE